MFKICQEGSDYHYFGSGTYGWCDAVCASPKKSSLVLFDLKCEAQNYIARSDLILSNAMIVEYQEDRVIHAVHLAS